MANGFPEGEFYLLNRDAMLCLAANPGGTSSTQSLGPGGGTIEYSTTEPPVVRLETPKPPSGNAFQGWYFDTSHLEYHPPNNYLVSRMKAASMGHFALQVETEWETEHDSLHMWGVGRSEVSTWQADDGYLFHTEKPDSVLTIMDRDREPRVGMLPRGRAHQRWHFIPFP
ncbi:hypothetical protein OG413_43050 [Streptomyces sp. NBC_01433]|uniref:hypothetical protein n=1 Tax=Streptomyces sp. NBC_01433 TaxID=2903864 RepID=UPI00224C91AF|nr:hypothetical protein [Streptomyces sp. NBC_01433]MCX4681973.1 hypothetical protein [Streptomyces sp. NBC_01433]